MTDPGTLLATARTAYEQRRWDVAHAAFYARDRAGALTADDLAAAADCAWWLGRVDESIAAGERAVRAFVEEARPRPAAMAAIGVAVNLLLRGDEVPGSSWLQRAAWLLADQPECAEQGYLAYLLEVERALDSPDRDAVLAATRRVAQWGRRLGDATLVAAGLLGEGRVLLRQGAVRQGLARFDEAMAFVLADEVLPEWAGTIYCHVMAATYEIGDLRRAWSWVRATSRWLETLPAPALFTGICRVHRSQVLQATGSWAESEAEAGRVCTDLADIVCLTAAEGHYQLGELARLRGHATEAEDSYRRAHQLGRSPQPGLALLRLRQGRQDAAHAAIRAALSPRRPTRWSAPGCGSRTRRSHSRPTTAPPRKRRQPSWRTWPGGTPVPPSLRRRGSGAAHCCSPRGAPMRPCPCCPRPARHGGSWTPCTSARAYGYSWPRRTGRWVTPTAPNSS